MTFGEAIARDFTEALAAFLIAFKSAGATPEQRTRLAQARIAAQNLPDDVYRSAVDQAFVVSRFDETEQQALFRLSNPTN